MNITLQEIRSLVRSLLIKEMKLSIASRGHFTDPGSDDEEDMDAPGVLDVGRVEDAPLPPEHAQNYGTGIEHIAPRKCSACGGRTAAGFCPTCD